MKILVNCCGYFSDGLDTPTRGEGRWTQNIARFLSEVGHDVYACTGGTVVHGTGRPSPAKLVELPEAVRNGPYDMYFDCCWTAGKKPMAPAKKYFHVTWWPEARFFSEGLPENHYVCYFLNTVRHLFTDRNINVNVDRTFFLPTPYCKTMAEPAFDNNGLLWCSRIFKPEEHPGRPSIEENYRYGQIVLDIAGELITEFPDLILTGLYKDFSADLKFPKSVLHNLIPYHAFLKLLQRTKLSLPVRMQSCIFDCTAAGVPFLAWEDTQLPGQEFIDVARKHGVLIEKGASKDRVKEVILTLLTNKEVYTMYTKDMQYVLRHHTEGEVLKCFQHIVDSVF